MTERILHIIPSLDRAGAEKQLVLLVTGLPRTEFEAHVCALTRGGPRQAELEAAGIPVTVIGKRFQADPLAAWRLTRHVAHLRPALVHTWLFAGNSYGGAAARAAGVRYLVISQRCVDPWKSRYQLAIDRVLARHAQRIVVNSAGVRDFYVQHGLPVNRVTVIPGGVAPAAPSSLTRGELLARLALPPSARLIGAVGRLWPQKRVKDLIWAADLAHLVRHSVHLLVIGDGPQRRNLERFVRLLRAAQHVRLLGERADVANILPHLDVCWLGSAYEGLPNSIMEAMAAGVPVVASDIPGCRELVVPGQTGFLVPVGGRAQRVRVTEKILQDPQLARRLGTAARQRVVEHFRVAPMVQQHVMMYRELLSG
ncbi:MAG: glycosyl transferase family 1 [Planctomycetes bacterium RBG_16_64_10]|nr:MAG: glycosyl transferase family 1 [Planctomycetes bacterium RBG_16_64_10]